MMPQKHLENDKPAPPDFTKITLADVIDVPALQEMMEDYYALTGIGVGILDLDGKVLVGTGWQDICVRFHRAVPESCAFCNESDISLAHGVQPGTFKEYRCKNNMWDIATPIMLGDRHIGNIFLGQFLYDDEVPDYDLFRAQARRYGYDETEYLAALDRVPRWNRETVRKAMGFYAKLARMISKTNYTNFILADTLARREQTEAALRLTRTSMEVASDAIFWIMPDARIIDVNEAASRSLGYSREELLQLGVQDFDPHYNAAIWKDHFSKIRQHGSSTFESEHRTKDGRVFPVEIVVNHVNFNGEEFHCSFVRDITERKGTENKLKETSNLLAKAQEMSHLGSWSLDLGTNRLFWSDEIYRIFGLQQQEFAATYEAFLDAVHPEDRDFVNSAYLDSIQTDKDGYEIEHRIIRKGSGQVRHVYEKCEHIRDEAGSIIRSEGMVHDISERKSAEESLWLMKHVFYASIAANSIAGLDGIIAEANDAFLKIWGYRSRDEVVGRPIWHFFINPDDAAAVINELNKRGLWEGEFFAKRGDGSTFIAYGMATQVQNKKGQVTGYQSACLDITDRKQAEADLLLAKVASEAANIAKSRFLATMSHEIRTPMSGVIGMIELLQHTNLTPEQHEYTENAKKSGIGLVHLLNDILDLSKIEADKLELELSAFDLRPVIADTINLLSLQAREKGVKLISSMDSDIPTALKGDAGRLRQLITNLVGNAIKFTPKGSVTLLIRKENEDEQFATLRFQISDSGIGIAPDKLGQIFEPFTQVDSSTTRKFGGTGLGLAICKRLTELMGGSIGVESAVGKGSTFWFTAVLEKLAGSVSASPEAVFSSCQEVKKPAVESGIRLLVAEDDPTTQLLLRSLLIRYGYSVDVVGNGLEALRALEDAAYDLVLMDCMMPEMNGYEATAIIRNPDSAVRRHDIPIIALTGNAMKQDYDRCIAAGMNDHLPKPFILKELLAKLEGWLKCATP